MLQTLLWLAASTAVAYWGYSRARRFVAQRLRYVDVVNHPAAPVVAAVAAAALATPIVAFLPIVGGVTAVAFGVSVGMGVAAGRSEIRRSLPPAS